MYFSAPKIFPNNIKINKKLKPQEFNKYEYIDRRPKGKKSIIIKGIVSYGFYKIQKDEKIPLTQNKSIISYECSE